MVLEVMATRVLPGNEVPIYTAAWAGHMRRNGLTTKILTQHW